MVAFVIFQWLGASHLWGATAAHKVVFCPQFVSVLFQLCGQLYISVTIGTLVDSYIWQCVTGPLTHCQI